MQSLVEASKIYALYGFDNTPTMKNLRVQEPFIGDVGYHMRDGEHDITYYDWSRFADFFDHILKRARK